MHLSGRSRHFFCYPVSSCLAYVTSILYELSDTFRFEVGDETRPRDRKRTSRLYSTACNNSTFRVCVVCCLCCVLFAYDHAAVISRVRAITLSYAGPNTAARIRRRYCSHTTYNRIKGPDRVIMPAYSCH